MFNKIGEVVADQDRLDYEEAGPKAPHGDISYKGIVLSSRYNVAREFVQMRRVIDSIPELMARRIEFIWCDSKASACYVVHIKQKYFVEELPHQIEDAFKGALGGYNGLSIECDRREIPYRDCYWPSGD